MSLRTTVRYLVAFACVAAMPLYAQTITTASKTATTTTRTHVRASASSRLFDDATRLAALLQDVQAKVDVSPVVWKTVANEANVLANRIAARAKGAATRKAALDARRHVREMRAAAMKGDASAARMHASEALPFVYTVIDASRS